MYESVWWCDPDAPAPGDVSRVDGIDESSLSVPSFDRSPPPASTTGGHEDGDEVLRASSDSFSAVSTSQAGSLSLRGGIGGGDLGCGGVHG